MQVSSTIGEFLVIKKANYRSVLAATLLAVLVVVMTVGLVFYTADITLTPIKQFTLGSTASLDIYVNNLNRPSTYQEPSRSQH
jgi:hypothetical protein